MHLFRRYHERLQLRRPELLRSLLKQLGVPPKMLVAVCQLYDGMRIPVQMDMERGLDWFDVEQGVHQGCNLAPLLFNLFLSAMLMLTLDEFCRDKDGGGGHDQGQEDGEGGESEGR